MRIFLVIIVTFLVVMSFSFCSRSKNKERNVDVRTLNENQSCPVYYSHLDEMDTVDINDDSIIYGYWFEPHAACYVNIFLHKDNSFKYKYVEADSAATQIEVKGKFEIVGEEIRMKSDQGTDIIMYHKHNGKNYYLTGKKSFYLVKGCNQP